MAQRIGLASAVVCAGGAILSTAAPAAAQAATGVLEAPAPVPIEPRDTATAGGAQAESALQDGRFLAFTLGARLPRRNADSRALLGYDTVTGSTRARGAAEARALDFLSLRFEYEHGPSTGSFDRVSLGARVAVLREERQGIDASVGLAYDPKDFRSEGNFVGSLSVARHYGAVGLFANALFGVDSEGDDQSLELRLASAYRVSSRVQIAWDGRGRLNLSTDAKRFGSRAVEYELQAGPSLTLTLGPIALSSMVGPSVLKLEEPVPDRSKSSVAVGVLALAGAGAAF